MATNLGRLSGLPALRALASTHEHGAERHRQRWPLTRLRVRAVLAGRRIEPVGPTWSVSHDCFERAAQILDVVAGCADTEAGPHRSRDSALVARLDLVADVNGLVVVDVQEVEHERVRTEAAVPDPDAVLGTQDRRDLAVPVPAYVERKDAQPRRASVPERVELDPWECGEPAPRVRRQLEFLGSEPVHAVACERPTGSAHGDRANDIGRARLLTLRQRGPQDGI